MAGLKPNDIFFFMFCHFWKIDPHFPSSLKACSSLSVLSLGLPRHFPVHWQWFAIPQLSTYWGCTPCTFRSSQKDCPSLYHPLVRLCFNKIVRRNIHFSVISHSLCNRTVMLFPVICISQGDIYQWLPILFIIAASIQFKSFYILIIVTDTSTIVWIACVNVIDRFLCNQGVLYLL